MAEVVEDFLRRERFQGWSTRLLGCLAIQLCQAGIEAPRSKLILHLVAHLPLQPHSGKSSVFMHFFFCFSHISLHFDSHS